MLTLFQLLLIGMINAEVIYRNTELKSFDETQNIECNAFPCVINCNAISSCRNTIISCPKGPTPYGVCFINLFNDYAGYQSIINTEGSTHIYINANSNHALFQSIINADQNIDSHLEIGVTGSSALQNATIYAPYGKGSTLTINCATNGYNCAYIKIYDDYSTTVSLQSHSNHAFYETEVKGKQHSSSDTKYHGSITLYTTSSHGFNNFMYYGTDHGNWNIESQSSNGFLDAVIYADHSFPTDESYTVVVNGSTQPNSMSSLTLYAQNSAVISLIGASDYSFNGFQLICDGEPSFIMDTFQMIAMAADAFKGNIISITNNIRDVFISGIESNSNGFTDTELLFSGTILNDVSFDVGVDDYRLYFNSIIHIKRVDGNVQFINGDGRGSGFFGSQITIDDGVGGNVLFVDNSTSDGAAFQNSNISILGGIVGNLEMHDESTDGYSFHNSNITVGENIGGFANLTSFSSVGSFSSTILRFNNISGDVQFMENAGSTNGGRAFEASDLSIGTVNGDLLFLSDAEGTFKQSTINIDSVGGTANFIARSYDVFSQTNINIKHCEYISFEANTSLNAFSLSNLLFGEKVNVVNVSVYNGDNALASSVWDCRSCSSFILNCKDGAGCGGVNNESVTIYCPQNNQRDKCKLRCSKDAVCDFVDIYTTNGYCSDVKVICDSETGNECTFTSTKIYCIVNKLHHYGVKTHSYCEMVQDANENDAWICENYVGEEDSFCVNVCTEEPTTNPTLNPTLNPAISNTTLNPTSNPKELEKGGWFPPNLEKVVTWSVAGMLILILLLSILGVWLGCIYFKKKSRKKVIVKVKSEEIFEEPNLPSALSAAARGADKEHGDILQIEEGETGSGITVEAMKHDPIALGVISTPKDNAILAEQNSDSSSLLSDNALTKDAVKHGEVESETIVNENELNDMGLPKLHDRMNC